MAVERRNHQRQTCTSSNGLWAGQIGSARHSASGLWQGCAYLRCIVHRSRTSTPACTSHFSAQHTICILALPSTPQSHAFQLLAMGITSSSSTRSTPCSIRSRRSRRYYRGRHDQSIKFSQSTQSGPSEVRIATLEVRLGSLLREEWECEAAGDMLLTNHQ